MVEHEAATVQATVTALRRAALASRRDGAARHAAAAAPLVAAALRVVHGGHEPNVVLLYRLARHSPGAAVEALLLPYTPPLIEPNLL